MNFLEQIKNAILTSKQLELKSENFSKLHKYFNKEYDDFSFKVEDTFELILDIGEKDYSINCLPSEKELNNDFYYFVVNEALREVDFPTNQKNYIFQLSVRNTYELRFEFLIELKHSYGNEGFELKKIHLSKIFSIQKYQPTMNKIWFKNDNFCEIIGNISINCLSDKIISKLKEDQKYFIELENQIKLELFGVVREISPKQKEFLSANRKLVNNWLNLNCKKELRNLIQVNNSCHYFSNNEQWLIPIEILNAENIYWCEISNKDYLSWKKNHDENWKITLKKIRDTGSV